MTQAPAIPANESRRLETLYACNVLDSESDPAFDELVRLAADLCAVPIALVSLVDHNRQWFKARVGLDATQTPRDISFCGHAILAPGELFEIEDAREDARFQSNPLVTGEPGIRFYAGIPLLSASGHALGTLCVIDREPRQLTPMQQSALRRLGGVATRLLESLALNQNLTDANDDLLAFATGAAHDLQTPLLGIRQLADFAVVDSGEALSDDSKTHLDGIAGRADRLIDCLHGLLTYSRIGTSMRSAERLRIDDIVVPLLERSALASDLRVAQPYPLPDIHAPETIAKLVFRHLLENAVAHHDRLPATVTITGEEGPVFNVIRVADDGPGIDPDYAERIFGMFETLTPKQAAGHNGLGLTLVRRALRKIGGDITLQPASRRGAVFVTRWPKP